MSTTNPQVRTRSVALAGPRPPHYADILSTDAMAFVSGLCRRFRPALQQLLAARAVRQQARDAGRRLDFRADTRSIREGDWRVAPIPADLTRRIVEITGPVDRKMIINALNSGADVFMADFEDASSPTWANMVEGQIHLKDAVHRTIEHVDPTSGRQYRLNNTTAVLLVRPRGLHLVERHLLIDGEPIPAPLFDFGLYLYHNARQLLSLGSGPYFYLPKLECTEEARWWNDVFVFAQEELGLRNGTIKATVLIETVPAAFEMDEILHALRDHAVGLNCGRWDYIFSYIKVHPLTVLPDRGQITMDQPFLRAYTQLLVRTCHRRGAFAMGGMAAQIPIKGDEPRARAALDKVRADKLREVRDGHDGTWVAHPGLVPIAREVFASHMTGDNQLHVTRDDVVTAAADLLAMPAGTRTEAGLRHNIRVGIRYLEAWLRGAGCVPLYDMMEDAATAEICRTQLWQWRRNAACLSDGRLISAALIDGLLQEELAAIAAEVGATAYECGRYGDARRLFVDLYRAEELRGFLTLDAYGLLN